MHSCLFNTHVITGVYLAIVDGGSCESHNRAQEFLTGRVSLQLRKSEIVRYSQSRKSLLEPPN